MFNVKPRWRLKIIFALCTSLIAVICFINSLEGSKLLNQVQDCEGFMSANHHGRLGNNMLSYATLYVKAQIYGYKPVMSHEMYENIGHIFPYLSIKTADGIPEFAKCVEEDKIHWVKINESDVEFHSQKENIFLKGFPWDLKNFPKFENELLKEFRFTSDIQQEVTNVLTKARKLFHDKNPNKKVIFVGVHVRRTDYPKHLDYLYKGVAVTPAYFNAAMDKFRQELNADNTVVAFILASDELKWSQEHFGNLTDVHFVWKLRRRRTKEDTFKSAEIDMAILGACDHGIIDYGSYGQWTAFLTGGKVIAATGFRSRNSSVSEIEKFLPPKWELLQDPCIDENLKKIC